MEVRGSPILVQDEDLDQADRLSRKNRIQSLYFKNSQYSGKQIDQTITIQCDKGKSILKKGLPLPAFLRKGRGPIFYQVAKGIGSL